MKTKKNSPFTGRTAGILALGIACVFSSFSLGMHSSGNVQPFTIIEAGNSQLQGDMNGNGMLDSKDVSIILEIVSGYREATVDHVKADPNEDGILTVDDALRILSLIER